MVKHLEHSQFHILQVNLPVTLIKFAIQMVPCLLMLASSWQLYHHPFESSLVAVLVSYCFQSNLNWILQSEYFCFPHYILLIIIKHQEQPFSNCKCFTSNFTTFL